MTLTIVNLSPPSDPGFWPSKVASGRWKAHRHYVRLNKSFMFTRAVWKRQKLEFAKGQRRFWTTSQHWFLNNFRNHDRVIRLLLNWQNMIYKNATSNTSVCLFFDKNVKRPELITKDVTALISEQFSESWLDYSSFAKLSKCDLHERHPSSATCVHACTLRRIYQIVFFNWHSVS